jgi:hypothetical protein
MVQAMRLKILLGGSFEWHHMPTEFHKKLPSGSEDIHRSFIPKTSNAFICPPAAYEGVKTRCTLYKRRTANGNDEK